MLNLDDITLVASTVACYLVQSDKIPQHTSILSGKLYVKELLETEGEATFRTAARMDKSTFRKLLSYLLATTNLHDSRGVQADEKLMIFLHTLVGFSSRQTADRFQHSAETISRVVHEVAESFCSLGDSLFVKADPNAVPREISDNPKRFPFFQNCIGALDGCHISAVVPPHQEAVFRNRKQFISQNVLAVVNFDLTFSFVLAGWEGSAHDGRVLTGAIQNGLPIYPGKFYLGDAGYALQDHCLTPYRGTRYHLKEWARGGRKPQNYQELFNLRHSSLRNCIERSFGIVKKRFPLLQSMHSYQLAFQIQLVMSCFMIHNFIRMNQGYEDDFDAWVESEHTSTSDLSTDAIESNNESAEELRDQIAQAMWVQYQHELEKRGGNA